MCCRSLWSFVGCSLIKSAPAQRPQPQTSSVDNSSHRSGSAADRRIPNAPPPSLRVRANTARQDRKFLLRPPACLPQSRTYSELSCHPSPKREVLISAAIRSPFVCLSVCHIQLKKGAFYSYSYYRALIGNCMLEVELTAQREMAETSLNPKN